jgi:translation initiation factor 1 (eIF-1/SUI1)
LSENLSIDEFSEILETLDKEQKRIKIRIEKRKFGKDVTIIEGISEDSAPEVARILKTKLACGGTYKNGKIELQGDHRINAKNILISMGYPESNITIE